MSSTTLQQFLAGEPLEYLGYKRSQLVAQRRPDGIRVMDPKGKHVCTADVLDRLGLTRFYHNVTRGYVAGTRQ